MEEGRETWNWKAPRRGATADEDGHQYGASRTLSVRCLSSFSRNSASSGPGSFGRFYSSSRSVQWGALVAALGQLLLRKGSKAGP